MAVIAWISRWSSVILLVSITVNWNEWWISRARPPSPSGGVRSFRRMWYSGKHIVLEVSISFVSWMVATLILKSFRKARISFLEVLNPSVLNCMKVWAVLGGVVVVVVGVLGLGGGVPGGVGLVGAGARATGCCCTSTAAVLRVHFGQRHSRLLSFDRCHRPAQTMWQPLSQVAQVKGELFSLLAIVLLQIRHEVVAAAGRGVLVSW